MKKLLIVAGSKNDLSSLNGVIKLFKKSKITPEVEVISVHRDIKGLVEKLEPKKLQSKNIAVILAVAHSVSNLPAVIAGYLKGTPIVVVGVGLTKTDTDSVASLLSVVSIPKDIPIVNAGINKVGLHNAALFCIKVLKS